MGKPKARKAASAGIGAGGAGGSQVYHPEWKGGARGGAAIGCPWEKCCSLPKDVKGLLKPSQKIQQKTELRKYFGAGRRGFFPLYAHPHHRDFAFKPFSPSQSSFH